MEAKSKPWVERKWKVYGSHIEDTDRNKIEVIEAYWYTQWKPNRRQLEREKGPPFRSQLTQN